MDESVNMKAVASSFRLSGLQLQPEAMKLLVDFTKRLPKNCDLDQFLSDLVTRILQDPISSSSIGRTVLEASLKQMASCSDEDDTCFLVINAFEVPRYEYVAEKKKFIRIKENACGILGNVDDRLKIFIERFRLVHQVVARHELFIDSIFNRQSDFKLMNIEQLYATNSASNENYVCLAMLSQLKDNKYFLEDTTGFMELDLTQTKFQTGFYVEQCVVLAEGAVKDGIFKAAAIGMPPIENAKKSREFHGSINLFGGPSAICASMEKLPFDYERTIEGSAFAFLSDVWLDDPKTLAKLRVLFEGFANAPPVCFVFCGHFLSKYSCDSNLSALEDGFKSLLGIIQEFPNILNRSNFVFVPSIHDPLITCILPTPTLPSSCLSSILSKLPYHHLATNPCRIRYFDQEIVVFREDLVEKMCRNCVNKISSDSTKLHDHLIRTILSQYHVSPFPLNVSPVYWTKDQALRIYPLPDLLVLCDKYAQYSNKCNNCVVSNPGSFSGNNFVFQLYYPASRHIDDSALPVD